jgi:hypothetical protein
MSNIEHKRGDTFDFSGPITVTQDGVPVPDLTGWQGFSQLRDTAGRLISDLSFQWLDASTSLCRLSDATTLSWPVGPAVIDIRLISPSGDVVSTATVNVSIIKQVTQNA